MARSFPLKTRAPAFTLLELLVASSIGIILLASLLKMSSSLLRAGLRENNQQTSQDAWVRVNQFLAIEVGEAARTYQGTGPTAPEQAPIVLNPTTSECGALPPSTTKAFAIRVPNPGNSTTPFRTITYYNVNNTNLMRCGPPVLSTGRLVLDPTTGASDSKEISYNTKLCQVQTDSNNRWIAYTMEFLSPQCGSTAAQFVGKGRAWAQSAIIQQEQ
ncbi:MAG: hypothetical protein ACKOYH_01445 [Cyanobium sp.]